MELTLDPRLASQIQRKIETGRYSSPVDVIREALRLLDESDRKREAPRAALAVGFDALDRGDVIEWTPDMMPELIHEAEEMTRQGINPNPDV